MKKTELKKYARLIARVGINVRKGQEVIVRAEVENPEFVCRVVEECYRAGAKSVTVDWGYQPLTKLNVRYRSLKTLSTVEDWELEKLKHCAATLPARIYLVSEDPDGLSGIDQDKFSKSHVARYKVTKAISDSMDNKYQWCIAAIPGKAWAKKVFPELRPAAAVEKLWDAILMTSRSFGDSVANWNEHNADLAKRSEYLNSLCIDELHYTAGNGTDLRVGLIDGAIFEGGGEYTLGGNYYNPNIPSEEVFTSPMRGRAEGIVYSTMPLSYRGQLIENFSIRFEGGKAVEVHAEKNEELLKQMISMDEGAAYLGECALVPFDSPIRNSGILFYNTLFDENAACHLALGAGFNGCLKGYEKLTFDQCKEMGINDSVIHTDFMIGCADLSVTGKCRDGREVAIFRDGNWAF